MKRYLLFTGDQYYPAGGWWDFTGAFDTIDAAMEHIARAPHGYDWWHIVDTTTMQEISHHP